MSAHFSHLNLASLAHDVSQVLWNSSFPTPEERTLRLMRAKPGSRRIRAHHNEEARFPSPFAFVACAPPSPESENCRRCLDASCPGWQTRSG
eukprot:4820799-Pleurochrysis_carterae.AAC.1